MLKILSFSSYDQDRAITAGKRAPVVVSHRPLLTQERGDSFKKDSNLESNLIYSYLMDEKKLIRSAQDGEFEAFSKLITAEKTKIYNLSLRMTGNKQDAEDIVQETFLKAIDKIGQFRGESSFGTWLFSITLNLARAHLSRNKKTDLRPIEDYLPGGGSVDMHEKATVSLFDWKDPHRQLEENELRGIVNSGLDSLPAKYREAFLLRYYEELSIKEIASLINESVAATKSRVLRARLALRDFLSKSFKDKYGKEVSGLY